MFEKVLVVVDGSAEALGAAKKAYSLLKEGCAKEITLLHVGFNPWVGLPIEDGVLGPTDEEVFRRRTEQLAQSISDKVKESIGSAQVNLRVEYGNVVDTICKIAKNDNYDLIVVGHGGEGKINRLMLGSVSSKLANIAPCPVLIYR